MTYLKSIKNIAKLNRTKILTCLTIALLFAAIDFESILNSQPLSTIEKITRLPILLILAAANTLLWSLFVINCDRLLSLLGKTKGWTLIAICAFFSILASPNIEDVPIISFYFLIEGVFFPIFSSIFVLFIKRNESFFESPSLPPNE